MERANFPILLTFAYVLGLSHLKVVSRQIVWTNWVILVRIHVI